MQVNRGFAFWGVALITAGVVALAIQAEVLSAETARGAWRLWPLLLIVIGVAVIAARTPFALVATLAAGLVAGGLAGTLVAGVPEGIGIGCSGEAAETIREAGTLDDGAAVGLDFNCGDLIVRTVDGDGWSVEARHGGDRAPTIDASNDELRMEAEGAVVFPFASEARQEWDVELPAAAGLVVAIEANAASSWLDLSGADLESLDVDANAGDARIFLSGTSVGALEIDGNAGSVAITADADTTLDGSVSMNAGSLSLCVPEDAAVALTLEDSNVTFGHNLDDSGLTQDGDTWSSGAGAADLALAIEGNAGSFTLNPEEGCG